uniref:Uncharacterized protein n=1 Tax=Anguilla anguilla TaxID=7936 RepID=A0A0E9PY79_ANGAN
MNNFKTHNEFQLCQTLVYREPVQFLKLSQANKSTGAELEDYPH